MRLALHLLLALALLASQVSGLVHGVAHGLPNAAAGSQPAGYEHGGHTPGSPLCQLLGHLGLADAAPSAPPALALAGNARHGAPSWRAAPQALPRTVPVYAARAPPAVA